MKAKNTNTAYNFVHCNPFIARGLTFGADHYIAAIVKNAWCPSIMEKNELILRY